MQKQSKVFLDQHRKQITTIKYLLFMCQICQKFKQTKLKKLSNKLIYNLYLIFKSIVSNCSANSVDGMSQFFQCMFTDSKIAKDFQLSRTRLTYIINFWYSSLLSSTSY